MPTTTEKNPNKVSIDHVGFVSTDLYEFERFWVEKLGFKNIWQSVIPHYKMKALFDVEYTAICRRYVLGDATIEVHILPECFLKMGGVFARWGINHFCLHVENREKFCKEHKLEPVLFEENGKRNYFLNDYEGNWIELRETL